MNIVTAHRHTGQALAKFNEMHRMALARHQPSDKGLEDSRRLRKTRNRDCDKMPNHRHQRMATGQPAGKLQAAWLPQALTADESKLFEQSDQRCYMMQLLLRAAPILALLVLILLIIVLTPSFLDVGPTSQYSNSSAQTASPALDRRIVENQNQGRVIQTLYQIEALAARTGWSADLRRLAGDLWEQIGDLPASVSLWEASDALQSEDQDAVRKLAQAYVTLTRWPDAAAALRRLIELSPRDPWAHYQLGLLLAASDPRAAAGHLEAASVSPTYEQVADALRAVISQQPADDLLPMRVGVALAEYELWPYAEVAFRQAVAVGRPLADALAYVGLSRDRQAKMGRGLSRRLPSIQSRFIMHREFICVRRVSGQSGAYSGGSAGA
jgi:tetratricopeptide (TPR) repeat protein